MGYSLSILQIVLYTLLNRNVALIYGRVVLELGSFNPSLGYYYFFSITCYSTVLTKMFEYWCSHVEFQTKLTVLGFVLHLQSEHNPLAILWLRLWRPNEG